MNTYKALKTLGAMALLAILPLGARGQDPAPGPPPPAPPVPPGGPAGPAVPGGPGGAFGPGARFGPPQLDQAANPYFFGRVSSTPNPMGLLMRPEVQSELRLNIRQKNALMQLMQQSAIQMRQSVATRFRDMRRLSPEERRARMEEMRATAAAPPYLAQGDLTPQVRELLKPNQIERLYQLDLQYRGPLALGDPRTAEKVQLSPAHRAEIARIAAEYETQRQQAVQQYMAEVRETAAVQGVPARPGLIRRSSAAALQNRLSPVRQKIEDLRKDAEARVLALLSPEERQQWEAAQGPKFKFRADRPLLGGFGNNRL